MNSCILVAVAYRGCASKDIFPSIHLDKGCSYQGQPSALWWFCEGEYCNGADIMDKCADWTYGAKQSLSK